jgi:acyl-CoA thioester hydrolase
MPTRTFIHTVRVIYAYTDQMSVVYYGRYFEFIEAARNELLRECGFTYKALESLGIMLPAVSAHLDYFSPARYDDEIEIHTHIEKLENVRVTIAYTAFEKSSRKKLFSGYTIHAFVNANGKPARPPLAFLEKLR